MSTPTPPLIPPSANIQDANIQKLKTDEVVTGSMNSNNSGIGFFQTSPVVQQSLDLNSPTLASDTVALLQTYGLASVPTSSVRSVTFQNLTSVMGGTVLKLYLQKGAPVPQIATLIATLTPTGPTSTFVWPIPLTQDADMDFICWANPAPPLYTTSFQGMTQVEFTFNSTTVDPVYTRDTYDISNVPPGISPSLNNGPRNAVVAASLASGYLTQQSQGYNIGVRIIPPPPPAQPYPPLAPVVLTTQTVTEINPLGGGAEAVGFANDLAYPKQITGYSVGSYTVQYLDPVFTVWPQ
jgi:hypothetical protein